MLSLPSCATRQAPEPSPEVVQRFRFGGPEAVEIRREKEERWTLSNGLTVLFIPDNELPLVSGALYIPGGDLWEKPGEIGVVSTMGSLMRSGGTKELSPDELDSKLRELAAEISSGFGDEFGTISFNCLASDVEEVLGLYRDVIEEPRFDESRLGLAKVHALEGIRRRKDDPETIANITSQVLMYRRSSKSGVMTSEDVRRLTRDSLVRAHNRFVRPDGAYLTITGNIDRKKLEALVLKEFSEWKPRGASLGEQASIPQPYAPGVYFVEGDFNQATVMGVQPGPPRHTEDRYAIRLMNNLFGDGLDSKLMKVVRSDKGLAYSVYGVVAEDYPVGKNLYFLQTKTESVAEALTTSLALLEEAREQPPTPDELRLMQEGAQSAFVFKFTSPGQILSRLVALKLLGFPEDYDETYIQRIFAVQPQDVVGAAAKWWQPQALRFVVVGNKAVYEQLRGAMEKDPLLKRYPLHKISFTEVPHGKALS